MSTITFKPLSRNRYRCTIGTRSFIIKKAAITAIRNNAASGVNALVGYIKDHRSQRPSSKKRHASKFRKKHS